MNDIEIRYEDGRYSVLLDGEEIASQLAYVEIEPMTGPHSPQVSLGLMPGHMFLAGESIIEIDSNTHQLLLNLGWTPPEEAG